MSGPARCSSEVHPLHPDDGARPDAAPRYGEGRRCVIETEQPDALEAARAAATTRPIMGQITYLHAPDEQQVKRA